MASSGIERSEDCGLPKMNIVICEPRRAIAIEAQCEATGARRRHILSLALRVRSAGPEPASWSPFRFHY